MPMKLIKPFCWSLLSLLSCLWPAQETHAAINAPVDGAKAGTGKMWSSGLTIGHDKNGQGITIDNGFITASQNQTGTPAKVVAPGAKVLCSAEVATDWDHWELDSNGDSVIGAGEQGDEPDNSVDSYSWTASGGFLTDANTRTPLWTAPFIPGKYTLTCRMNNTPKEIPDSDSGTRADADLVRTITVQVYSVTMTPAKTVVAVGHIANDDGHKSEVEFKVLDSDGQPVAGVGVPLPIDISDGHGMQDTINAGITLRTSVTNAAGIVLGDFLSGNRTQTATLKIFYNPADAPTSATGAPVNASGLGPSMEMEQAWNERAGQDNAWDDRTKLHVGPIAGKTVPITYIMTYDDGKAIKGHHLKYTASGLTGLQWNPKKEVDEDGDGVVDYVGGYDEVSYSTDENGDIGANGIYNKLVTYSSLIEGPNGHYTGTQTIHDHVNLKGNAKTNPNYGRIDYYVDYVSLDVTDNSSRKKATE